MSERACEETFDTDNLPAGPCPHPAVGTHEGRAVCEGHAHYWAKYTEGEVIGFHPKPPAPAPWGDARDKIALEAMRSLLTIPHALAVDADTAARDAYKIADAMLRAREEEPNA